MLVTPQVEDQVELYDSEPGQHVAPIFHANLGS